MEEQKDMMRLLARDAKKVYDCAVQVLPSSLFNISERCVEPYFCVHAYLKHNSFGTGMHDVASMPVHSEAVFALSSCSYLFDDHLTFVPTKLLLHLLVSGVLHVERPR